MHGPWVRWIAFTAVLYSLSLLYVPALHAEPIDFFDPNGVSPDDPQFFQLVGGENRAIHVQQTPPRHPCHQWELKLTGSSRENPRLAAPVFPPRICECTTSCSVF